MTAFWIKKKKKCNLYAYENSNYNHVSFVVWKEETKSEIHPLNGITEELTR